MAEAVKRKYGDNISAVGGFTTLAGAVKPEYGHFSVVSGFSFFGGNVNGGDLKLGDNCGGA